MKLSTRTTYGLKALIYLAKSGPDAVSLADIAKQEKISLKYLEAIFSRLKKSQLVTADRGANGGYSLKDAPSKISIALIFQALEGDRALASCRSNHKIKYCANACHCGVSQVTEKLNQAIDQTLNKLTLKDLINKN